MRINKNYLNRFTKNKYEYLYPISKGIYLAFDLKTLKYIGIELLYTPFYSIEKQADELLNELLCKSILELDTD